jgi:hypothetical protein
MSSVGGLYRPLGAKNTTLAFARGSVQAEIQKILAHQARFRTSSMFRCKVRLSIT